MAEKSSGISIGKMISSAGSALFSATKSIVAGTLQAATWLAARASDAALSAVSLGWAWDKMKGSFEWWGKFFNKYHESNKDAAMGSSATVGKFFMQNPFELEEPLPQIEVPRETNNVNPPQNKTEENAKDNSTRKAASTTVGQPISGEQVAGKQKLSNHHR